MGEYDTPETMAEIERQLVSVITGWPLPVVDQMSARERRLTLVFRDEWHGHLNKK